MAMAKTLAEDRRRAEEEEEQAASPKRVLRLTILCIVLLLAGFFTYTGVKGFANPLPLQGDFASVELAVQTTKPTAAQLKDASWQANFPIEIAATFDQDMDNDAMYQITVPAKYAGKRYAFMVKGSARIDHVSRTIPEPPVQAKPVTCTYSLKGYPSSTGPCELITGTFPAGANTSMSADDTCGWGGWSPGSDADNAVEIEFDGPSHITTASDWAYQQYSLPSLVGEQSNSYLSRWNGVPPAG
jgi:hypothetical protein